MRPRPYRYASDPYGWLRAARTRLRVATWGSDALPTTLATSVTRSYTGASYRRDYDGGGSPLGKSGLQNCGRVDRYLCDLYGDWTSEIHACFPATGVPWNGKILRYNGGHVAVWDGPPGHGDNTNEVGVIDLALQAGFIVLMVPMPEYSYNSAAFTVTFPDTSVHTLGAMGGGAVHDYSLAEAAGMSTLRFFLDPGIVGLNQLLSDVGAAPVFDAGISGGGDLSGWLGSTDTRSVRQYEICGSVPFDIATILSIGPDYEQSFARPWWTTIGPAPAGFSWDPRLVLYAMSCFETGRKRVQTLVDTDPVFTAVTVHTQINAYAAQLAAFVPSGQSVVNINAGAGTVGFHTIPQDVAAATVADMIAA